MPHIQQPKFYDIEQIVVYIINVCRLKNNEQQYLSLIYIKSNWKLTTKKLLVPLYTYNGAVNGTKKYFVPTFRVRDTKIVPKTKKNSKIMGLIWAG
jgi:hypothetical protein